MTKLPNHTALKEWSTVVESLGAGRHVLLLRKGGIADPAFGVEAERFYLFPTYFHQGEPRARPVASIRWWCAVRGVWELAGPASRLDALAPLAALPREALEARTRFRPDQSLYAIAVRTHALRVPVEVAWRDAYAGCTSWISLEDEVDIDGSEVVLDDGEFTAALAEVASLLDGASARRAD